MDASHFAERVFTRRASVKPFSRIRRQTLLLACILQDLSRKLDSRDSSPLAFVKNFRYSYMLLLLDTLKTFLLSLRNLLHVILLDYNPRSYLFHLIVCLQTYILQSLAVEGTHSPRQRKREVSIKRAPLADKSRQDPSKQDLSSPKGEQSATMAAGTSRILRYVLFAFFVGVAMTMVFA